MIATTMSGKQAGRMNEARAYFEQLNHDYIVVHKTKEDLFWATYMGTSDDHDGFARAESSLQGVHFAIRPG